jgi:hypothetical protein
MTLGSHQTAQRLALATAGLAFGLGVAFALAHPRPRERAPAVGAAVVRRAETAKRPRAKSSPLPQPVLNALARGDLVVLSFVMPGSQLDTTAAAEAHAGARSSGAPFFAIDASSTAAARLLRRYGLESTPAVVVLTPPNRLTFRASMFLDEAAIRQAIADARG